MERLETEAETPVAPHEVRELLTRLNEGSVEALPPSETRTLGGLAVETGIPIDRLQEELDSVRGRRPAKPKPWLAPVALLAISLGIGGWLWTATLPKPAPPLPMETLPAKTPELSNRGLVGLDQVTYGPDSGSYRVEPNFAPSQELPPGLSIAADVKGVVWGAGDHRAAVLTDPLSDAQAAQLTRSLEELLGHVRKRADKRGIPLDKSTMSASPDAFYDDAAFWANVRIESYGGNAYVQVPIPPPGVDDADFARLSKAGAKRAVAELQQSLRWRKRIEG